jgi:hypothetical protein
MAFIPLAFPFEREEAGIAVHFSGCSLQKILAILKDVPWVRGEEGRTLIPKNPLGQRE